MPDGLITRKALSFVALVLVLLIGAGWFVLSGDDVPVDALPETVDFNQHIRPILSTNCYVCHGPDISTREAGLRLDIRDSAIVQLESGATAVVPGNHQESELIRRVSATNPEERMPPSDVKKTLSEYEINLLKRWIDQGAEWKKHWSLEPVDSTIIPPPVRRRGYVDNDIDRFLLKRLEKEGLKPAETASKESLIRRLSFVLTGLPPTPEGVRAFVEDSSPDAYEKLVDRMLDSPHFGERWARHWMDVVRYADTKGHEFDFPVVGAWQYRDYLIRAFNEDIPYDQFIMEQLAGDLLENPRMHPEDGYNESLLGTAYFALGEGTHSPVDLVIDESERINNIIDVTSKTFQGLTVSCAKCHDHKFDPIPTTDYYSWYGIVKSTRFAHHASVDESLNGAVEELALLRSQIKDSIGTQWKSDVRTANWETMTVEIEQVPNFSSLPVIASDSSALKSLGDFQQNTLDGWRSDGLAFGDTPLSGDLTLDEETGAITSLGLPRASSMGISSRLAGALRSPSFTIEHDYITVRAAGKQSLIRIVIDNFQLIRYPIYGGLERSVDNDEMQDYLFDVGMWKGQPAYIELFPGWDESEQFVIGDSSYIDAAFAYAHTEGLKDSPLTGVSIQMNVTRAEVTEIIDRWIAGEASWNDVQLLNGLISQEMLSTSIRPASELLKQSSEVEAMLVIPELFMGVVDGDGVDHPVFIRGSVQNLSEDAVPRRALTVYDESQSPFVAEGSGRLEWAASISDPSNSLTARVMVNRLWHHIFGRGLVETVDNFGVQGKMPSHPELLDYLAIRFIQSGWSIKTMIREMVLSQAFQRSVNASDKAVAIDPNNVWLQHYSMRRLESEAIRDAMLSVSGSLNPSMYGESVPVHLSEFMTGRGRPRASGPLDGEGRRSLYTSVRRNFLPPMMLVFDMPIPFTTFGRRNTSSVPAQSLTLLNDPFVAEQAERWAARLVTLKELDAEGRIKHIYKTAFARDATEDEIQGALEFLQNQAATYTIASDAWLNDTRPWKDYCHAVFNMKEFIHLI